MEARENTSCGVIGEKNEVGRASAVTAAEPGNRSRFRQGSKKRCQDTLQMIRGYQAGCVDQLNIGGDEQVIDMPAGFFPASGKENMPPHPDETAASLCGSDIDQPAFPERDHSKGSYPDIARSAPECQAVYPLIHILISAGHALPRCVRSHPAQRGPRGPGKDRRYPVC